MNIYLASRSPRRIEILKDILGPYNRDISVILPDFKELNYGYAPERLVLLNSKGKLESLLNTVSQDSVVISADTIVCIDESILGKPIGIDEARNYLKRLSDRDHYVYTGVSIYNKSINKYVQGYDETIVTFNKLSNKEIEDYINEFRPFDKAGGYGIQEIGYKFVSKITGSYSNIVGLPKALTHALLQKIRLINC